MPSDEAGLLYDLLACQGILVRYFHAPSSLRFGLPRDEQGWVRLERALVHYREVAA